MRQLLHRRRQPGIGEDPPGIRKAGTERLPCLQPCVVDPKRTARRIVRRLRASGDATRCTHRCRFTCSSLRRQGDVSRHDFDSTDQWLRFSIETESVIAFASSGHFRNPRDHACPTASFALSAILAATTWSSGQMCPCKDHAKSGVLTIRRASAVARGLLSISARHAGMRAPHLATASQLAPPRADARAIMLTPRSSNRRMPPANAATVQAMAGSSTGCDVPAVPAKATGSGPATRGRRRR